MPVLIIQKNINFEINFVLFFHCNTLKFDLGGKGRVKVKLSSMDRTGFKINNFKNKYSLSTGHAPRMVKGRPPVVLGLSLLF